MAVTRAEKRTARAHSWVTGRTEMDCNRNRAGRGRVVCSLDIAKEVGFYSRCQRKPLRNFKNGEKQFDSPY